jgi:hypothetical protein
VGDEPAVTGARASFPNFPNLTVVAGCLIVVALRRCRHGGERGGAGGEAASDDALNLSHFLQCDRCDIKCFFCRKDSDGISWRPARMRFSFSAGVAARCSGAADRIDPLTVA